MANFDVCVHEYVHVYENACAVYVRVCVSVCV